MKELLNQQSFVNVVNILRDLDNKNEFLVLGFFNLAKINVSLISKYARVLADSLLMLNVTEKD